MMLKNTYGNYKIRHHLKYKHYFNFVGRTLICSVYKFYDFYKIYIKKLTQTSCRLFIWELNTVIVVMDSCSDTFFTLRFIIGGLWFTINRHRAAVTEKNNFNFSLGKKIQSNIYTHPRGRTYTCFTYLKQCVKYKKKNEIFFPKII